MGSRRSEGSRDERSRLERTPPNQPRSTTLDNISSCFNPDRSTKPLPCPRNAEHYPRYQTRLDSAPDDVTEQYYGRSICTDPFNLVDDVVNPGATAILKVTKPAAAKTHRVWLVKY